MSFHERESSFPEVSCNLYIISENELFLYLQIVNQKLVDNFDREEKTSNLQKNYVTRKTVVKHTDNTWCLDLVSY